jgi:hypothetical protein
LVDQVEPQLDQVGSHNGIALTAQLRHRGCSDGNDETWFGHKKSLFNRFG